MDGDATPNLQKKVWHLRTLRLTTPQIAARTGLSPPVVRRLLEGHPVPPPRATKPRSPYLPAIRAELAQGQRPALIASRLGITRQAVEGLIRRHGLTAPARA